MHVNLSWHVQVEGQAAIRMTAVVHAGKGENSDLYHNGKKTSPTQHQHCVRGPSLSTALKLLLLLCPPEHVLPEQPLLQLLARPWQASPQQLPLLLLANMPAGRQRAL
jgi:hypothetical protein